MSQPITRRTLISGCLALGTSACLPTNAWAGTSSKIKAIGTGPDANEPETSSEQEGSTPKVPEMEQVIWDGLVLSIPSCLEWNDSSSYGDTSLEAPVYSGIASGINYIVYVQKWQENDLASDAWESLLSCNLETWAGITANNESILGSRDVIYTEEHDNKTLKIMTVCGSEDAQSDEKRVCSLATDGQTAWYILLVLRDGGFDEESRDAAARILDSIEIADEDDIFANSDWTLRYGVDKYNEPTDERYIMNRLWFEGSLSSATELNSDVQVAVGVTYIDGVFLIFKKKATDEFVQGMEGDTLFTGSMRAGDGTELDLSGMMNQGKAQLWLDANKAAKVIQAFMDGGRISFRLEDSTSAHETYTFSINVNDDFQRAYEFIRQ